MREAGKPRELQAQLKKACMLDAEGHFKKQGDKRRTSDSDCPCGRCQCYNCDVKDCFNSPENASKRPEGYKTRKQCDKERARRGAAEEEEDDEDDKRPAIVSVARAWLAANAEELACMNTHLTQSQTDHRPSTSQTLTTTTRTDLHPSTTQTPLARSRTDLSLIHISEPTRPRLI
eukprot:2322641-Rhodomonas_salina.2